MDQRSRMRGQRVALPVLALILAVLVGSACDAPAGAPPMGGTPPAPVGSHGGPVKDHFTLLDHLRQAGLMVNPVGQVEQPFLSGRGESVEVDGEVIQSFQYDDEATAAKEAAQIQPDATIPGSQILWTAQPHFYRSGSVIVIYPGTSQKVLDALEQAMGTPFAVGPSTSPN